MELYTLLLVDDEEDVVRAIMRRTDWDALGFSVAGYATNGAMALELVERLQPDVVMTDIRMPYMDGLELSERVKKEYPATKVLFFSGFDEFEYAREAVRLEAEEYILKPVNSAELSGVLSRLKEKLDRESEERRNIKMLRRHYLKSLPALQESFYVALLERKVPEDEIPDLLRDYGVSMPGPFYCCLIAHTSAARQAGDINPLFLSASVQKHIEERIGERWNARCFSYLGDAVMFAQLARPEDVSELTDDCDRFCRYAVRALRCAVTVGIGHVCAGIMELSGSYKAAREAVCYRAIYGVSRAIFIQEISTMRPGRPAMGADVPLSRLIRAIYLDSAKDVEKAAEKYLDEVFYPEKSLQAHYVDIMDLVGALYRVAEGHGVDPQGLLGDIRHLFGRLFDLDAGALRAWLMSICLSLQDSLSAARNHSANSLVVQAKEFIKDHYAEEAFSLDSVSRALGVSNSYLSTIFKKATGNSMVGYLTECRLANAARLLLETDDKSYAIAECVGYSDPNYFSYVFKRRYGLSPTKYRTEHKNEEKVSGTPGPARDTG